MKRQSKSFSFHTKEFKQTSFSIINEFCIKNSYFLIILFEENVENNQNLTLIFSGDTLYCSTVGYFEFEDKCYSIVKTETTLGNTDPVLINLLTERELQIATLAALGRSNKQIASHLHISEWTVSAHLRRIFIKLNVDSRAAMVYRCASLIDRVQQLGLISYQTCTGSGTEKV